MNLITEKVSGTPSYWCTWWLQNVISETASEDNAFGCGGHSLIANKLTQKNVEDFAYKKDLLKKVRKDLYVLYDLGWDVPINESFDDARWKLGAMEVVAEKFPFCIGSPTEKLRKLNDYTKNYGWRGAGLWVPANAYGDGEKGQMFTKEEQEEVLRERLRWSHKAGIEYWKVDYGSNGWNADYRKMLTNLAKEEAPGLIIEHAYNVGPLNDQECPWGNWKVNGTGLFSEWDDGNILRKSLEIANFSEVFRAYDITISMATPTMLDRIANYLKTFSGQSSNLCILNCESEAYLGAALGCAIGIMDFEPKMMDQHIRTVRWQRIAPAVGIGVTENLIDFSTLTDTWDFRKGSDWATFVEGKNIKQCAPARVARNMTLPQVEKSEDESPYVLCSKHPNGAIAIATIPRISIEKGRYCPKAKVTIDINEGKYPIGIFGEYKELCLNLSEPIGDKRIWAQDLAGDEAQEITNMVLIKENSIIINGELIYKIGLSAASEGDGSAPGMVLVLK